MAWNAIFLPCNFIPRMNFALYIMLPKIFLGIFLFLFQTTLIKAREI